MTDDWIRSSKYSFDHTGGRWRISAARIGVGWLFSLWRKTGKVWSMIGSFNASDEAKQHVINLTGEN